VANRSATAWIVLLALTLAAGALPGCADTEREEHAARPETAPAPAADRLGVLIGGEPFDLELALDPASRYRGLSGRASIPSNGGLLFVFPDSRPREFVMRDCFVPIDIAFLDERGRILAIHEMPVEAPRGADESPQAYEARLARWSSELPARFAIELAGGRLASLGVHPGQYLVFDVGALAARAR